MTPKLKRIVVDIDGTICLTLNDDFENATPYLKRIEKVNELYDEGYTIVFFTARGSYTGLDWRELTLKQLKEWGVKYHELIMGKPYAEMYIDDRAEKDSYLGLPE